MLVLIDESGCPGFKLTQGSTPYFVVAMVIFTDFSEAEKTSAYIAQLRQKWRVGHEFKFNKSRADIRAAFFQALCPFNFKVRALVVNKSLIYSQHLRYNTESFYYYFMQRLMKHDNQSLNEATIKLDGRSDKPFKSALSTYLRQHIGAHKLKKLKFIDSKKDNLIQLADMVVGAIARSYHPSRSQADHCYRLLKDSGKIENIWDFK